MRHIASITWIYKDRGINSAAARIVGMAAYPQLNAVSLRDFKPVGAHRSHLIGENPKGVPSNLLPFVAHRWKTL